MNVQSGAGRSILTTVLTFAVATIAMAAGASMNKPSPVASPSVEPVVSADPSRDSSGRSEDTPGGSIERVHDVTQCGLIDVSTLQGNWTHGDYVSAVAVGSSNADVREAAQSDCGKPTTAVQPSGLPGNTGGAPPEHATHHADDGQAHAGGPPHESGPGETAWASRSDDASGNH
jgi:hypothetical protein